MIKVNNHLSPKDIITQDHYKGSIIEKAYGGGDNGLIASEIIKAQLNNKLEKGIIDQDLFDKAMWQLEELVKGGEGSKGGHIIGHTKSGKVVYAGKKASENKDFTAQDHRDAAELHFGQHSIHNQKSLGTINTSGTAESHRTLANHHIATGSDHNNEAHSQIQSEHESGLSADEKKIVADQNKKKKDDHGEMAKYHDKAAKFHSSVAGDNPYIKEHAENHKKQAEFHRSEAKKIK